MTTKVLNERHFLRVVVENNPKGPFMYVTKFPTSQKFQSGYPFGSLDPGVTRDPVFFPHQGLNGFPKCGKMNRLDEEGPLMTLPS